MNDVTQRSPRRSDVGALVGLLATLEGELMARDPGHDEIPEWAHHLARRLGSDGLLPPEAGNHQLRQALNDLNHRLRYVAGEYDEPPTRVVVP